MANHNGVYYSSSSGLNLRTNATTRINISTGGVIQFNSEYTFPTTDGSANTVLITDGNGALSFGTVPNAGLTNSSITINGTAVSLGGSINVGDITGVSAGTGLTGGGTSGSVTVSLDYAGVDNFIDSATNLEGTAIAAGDTIVYHDATDNNVKKGLVSDLPFSNNSGTVTSVNLTAGALIDVSGGPITSSGSITVDVDLSELTDMTAGMVGTDEFVVLDASAQRRKAANEIGLSIFNNDAGFTTNTGTVTSVAISGTDGIDVDSGSPITSSGTITLGLSNVPNTSLQNSSITINGNAVSLGGSINVGDITAVTAGNGLTGGGTTGAVTLNVGAGTGISVAADTVGLNYSGVNNFVISATDGTQSQLSTSDFILFSDGSTDDVSYAYVGDLPFSNNSGTVTSVAISGTDGIDVDSGSPITSSGTITLGLSNVPNSSLQNSSITIAGSAISLGGSITADLIIGQVSAGEILLTQLEEDSITINGTVVPLGGSINVGDITGVSAGTGLTGGGTSGAVTVSLDYAGTNNFIDSATNLEGTGIALTDTIVYHDATDNNVKKGLVSDLPFTSNVGDITAVTAGNGLTGGGTSGAVTLNVGASTGITVTADAVALDYFGTDNFMYSAPNFQGTAIDYDDVIIYHDGATNNVRRALVNDLPFSNNSGTVTSVAITGTDGIDVDSGSPITTSGTITLGLSNVPNTSLANSSITINGTAVSLGGSINVGDITGVSAGTGLTGGGTSGSVTVSIDYAGVDNFIDSATNLEGTAISTADTIIYHDATDNNVKKGLVSDLPFTSNVGDITAVTAGNGLTGGGTSGAVTLDVGAAIGGGIVVGANDISLDTTSSRNIDHDSVSVLAGTGLSGGGTISVNRTLSLDYAGTDNFIDSATNLEGTDIATNDTIVYHDATDNNVKKGLVSDLPFTNNLGTVTSVGITAGSLIDVTGGPITSSGNITVNVDLSELTTSTNNNDADFFAVIDSSNVQRKIGKGTVTLSGFNDDVSFYRNNGTLNTARLVTQAGNQLTFNSTAAETTSFSNTIATPVRTPRVHMEAGALYSAVLELNSSEPPVNLIEGNDVGQSNVFMVDGLGNLTATSKAFDIPHPNPEKKEQGMRLKHGNLEGPEHGVYVRGRQIDDKEIELPEYWRDLVDPDSITVQLTSVGSHQNLYVKEIKDNVVYIGNGNLFSNKIDCYYFIQAERKDIDKIKVEYQK